MAKRVIVSSIVALICLVRVPSLNAQTTTTLYGAVVDKTGATVPGAEVAATNVDTNLSWACGSRSKLESCGPRRAGSGSRLCGVGIFWVSLGVSVGAAGCGRETGPGGGAARARPAGGGPVPGGTAGHGDGGQLPPQRRRAARFLLRRRLLVARSQESRRALHPARRHEQPRQFRRAPPRHDPAEPDCARAGGGLADHQRAQVRRPRRPHLRAWFIDDATRMNPNLQYAQAIKGRFTGRGTGIIDTLHLVEVARAASRLALAAAPTWTASSSGLRRISSG